MASPLIPATELSDGDVLLLPFNRTATVQGAPKVGRQFVNFRTEFGKTRVSIHDQLNVEVRVA